MTSEDPTAESMTRMVSRQGDQNVCTATKSGISRGGVYLPKSHSDSLTSNPTVEIIYEPWKLGSKPSRSGCSQGRDVSSSSDNFRRRSAQSHQPFRLVSSVLPINTSRRVMGLLIPDHAFQD